jgi:protein-disulfide isomerase
MDNKNWFDRYGMAVSLFLGLVIIAGAIYFGGKFQPNQQNNGGNTGGQPAATADIKDVKTDGIPFVGNANAPVTMAVYFDYQCPFCKQFDQTVTAELYKNYVQSGKLKILFKDFDFIGPDSLVASEYGRAVWELYPNQYYAWYTAMFGAQDEENKGFGDEASVKKLTGTIQGIDANKVAALVTQKKSQYDTAIQASFTEGQGFGIQGTPSVIVGKTLLQGAQTYANVAAAVDKELKK